MPMHSLLKEDRDGNSKTCKICGKKLRPLTKSQDWDSRVYHVTCFRDLISDISKFDHLAFKKYGYKRKVNNNVYVEDFEKGKNPLVISFD